MTTLTREQVLCAVWVEYEAHYRNNSPSMEILLEDVRDLLIATGNIPNWVPLEHPELIAGARR